MKTGALVLTSTLLSATAQNPSPSPGWAVVGEGNFQKMVLQTLCCARSVTKCLARCEKCLPGQQDTECGLGKIGGCDPGNGYGGTYGDGDTTGVIGIMPIKDVDEWETLMGGVLDAQGQECRGFCKNECSVSSSTVQDAVRVCYAYPGLDGKGGEKGTPPCQSGAMITMSTTVDSDYSGLTAEAFVEWLNENIGGVWVPEARRHRGRQLQTTFTASQDVTEPEVLANMASYSCEEPSTRRFLTSNYTEIENNVVNIGGEDVTLACERENTELPEDPCAQLGMADQLPVEGLGFLADMASAVAGCDSATVKGLSAIAGACAVGVAAQW